MSLKNPVFSDTPVYGNKTVYGDNQPVRTDILSVTDWLGHEVSIGEKVIYCIGAGAGQMMAIGEVKAMRAGKRRRWDYETRTYSDTEFDWEIEVQVLTEKTSGAWNNKTRTRPAWVNPMNITSLKAVSE